MIVVYIFESESNLNSTFNIFCHLIEFKAVRGQLADFHVNSGQRSLPYMFSRGGLFVPQRVIREINP